MDIQRICADLIISPRPQKPDVNETEQFRITKNITPFLVALLQTGYKKI